MIHMIYVNNNKKLEKPLYFISHDLFFKCDKSKE
jgi:hypothetical protein